MSSLQYEELRATKEGYQRDVISRLLSQKENEDGKTKSTEMQEGWLSLCKLPALCCRAWP